jgi:hypothetical protein
MALLTAEITGPHVHGLNHIVLKRIQCLECGHNGTARIGRDDQAAVCQYLDPLGEVDECFV